MARTEHSVHVSEIERQLLRALIGTQIESSDWTAIDRELGAYAWREPDHTVVYKAIVRARSRDQKNWRKELPAQATRMGFPDLDWQELLGPTLPGAPKPQPQQLIRQLKRKTDSRT